MRPIPVGTAALLLVLAAALARPSPREESAPRGTARILDAVRAETAAVAFPPPVIDAAASLPVTEGLGPARRIEQDAEERFRARIREREDVMDATAGYLGWDERQKAVARAAVEAIRDAWRIRDLDLGAEPSPSAQESYEAVKRLALESVAAELDPSRDRHRRFGERLEEWIDAVR